MNNFSVTVENEGRALVLVTSGRVDYGNAKTFESELMQAMKDGTEPIVIDLAGMDYISSAGLRVLLLAGKRAKAESRALVLAAPNPSVSDVFEISGFRRLFKISDTRASALEDTSAS